VVSGLFCKLEEMHIAERWAYHLGISNWGRYQDFFYMTIYPLEVTRSYRSEGDL
jgi:hypothetical protein